MVNLAVFAYVLRTTTKNVHWLPVRQRVKFKTAVLVFKCLHGLAPAYLADYCQPTTVTAGRTRLRSANTHQLASQQTNTGYGDRSFAVSGPSVWNSLPTALRMSDCSLTTFRTGYGDRSFAVSGPSVWNSLPTALRMSDCSLTTFRTQLKTLLFI